MVKKEDSIIHYECTIHPNGYEWVYSDYTKDWYYVPRIKKQKEKLITKPLDQEAYIHFANCSVDLNNSDSVESDKKVVEDFVNEYGCFLGSERYGPNDLKAMDEEDWHDNFQSLEGFHLVSSHFLGEIETMMWGTDKDKSDMLTDMEVGGGNLLFEKKESGWALVFKPEYLSQAIDLQFGLAINMMKYFAQCEVCYKIMFPSKSTALTCSIKCRVKKHRSKQK